MGKKEGKKRFRLRRGDVAVLIALAIMALLAIIFNVANHFGLVLVHGEIYMLLPALILIVAVGWAGLVLIRMIKRRGLRIALGTLAGIALLVVVMVGMSYLSFAISMTTPQQYATVRTEDRQHSLLVMRQLDTDESRMEERRAARVAADPDGDAEIIADDWGYIYTAYVPTLGIFYKRDSLIEGECRIGYASGAELMVEWQEDGRVGHFFVENPGPADGGEMWSGEREPAGAEVP